MFRKGLEGSRMSPERGILSFPRGILSPKTCKNTMVFEGSMKDASEPSKTQ